jgi:outer membrane protein assembly factor BamA
VLQTGVTVDTRDFEPWPSEGFFAEASLRAASPLWGSSARANYQGIDAAWSSYALLLEDHSLVLANRALVDLMWGDVPVDDLASTGGTRNHAAFGGQWIGRGIRDHRYVGKIKVIDQIELRSDVVTLHAFGARLDVGSALFVDAAWIGADWDDFGGDPFRVLFGVGAGVNVLLNRAIQLRIDIAASPYEQNVPALYTPVKFPF